MTEYHKVRTGSDGQIITNNHNFYKGGNQSKRSVPDIAAEIPLIPESELEEQVRK